MNRKILACAAICVFWPRPAYAQVQDSTATSCVDASAVVATAAAGFVSAPAGYHMAPTIAAAIGFGETTRDVRVAGAVGATAILIPLAFRQASSRQVSGTAYLVSGLLGAAGMAAALAANNNQGMQRAVLIAVPIAQLVAVLAIR